jgi:cystathionine beta-synthase
LHTDDDVHLDGIDVVPITDRGAPMAVAQSLLDLVGNTPLVVSMSSAAISVVTSWQSSSSSIPAEVSRTVLRSHDRGLPNARDCSAPVAPSSSPRRATPVSASPSSRHAGRYRCVFVMPDKVAPEKISLLRAYGAEVVVCPTTVAPEHPESYYSVSDRLAREIPGAYKPNQYQNPDNPRSHELSTGPELWQQTAGRITHFVAGVGTGGTITGVARYLKSQNPAIQIIGADPEGSVYSGGTGRPYLVEGIGEDFWPGTYDPSVVDRVVAVSDADSFLTARRVTREEGILVGGSAGTAVWAALQVGRELGPSAVVVVLIPDSGRGYLSKLYDDKWLADFGFLRSVRAHRRRCARLQRWSHPRARARASRRVGARRHLALARVLHLASARRQSRASVVGRRGRRRGARPRAHGAGLSRSDHPRQARRRRDGSAAARHRYR